MAPDQPVRNQALNVRQSYIVQAPAGSGKTELLIQRYLTLMAIVDEPEEVLAITFTRKAAAEMRKRVIEAFIQSQQPEPDSPHARATWKLARRALTRSDERDWDILRQPARLRIMTIDSLNASLVHAMPWLSGIGSDVILEQKPQYLYEEAVWQIIDTSKADKTIREALQTLLLHLDNHDRHVVNLLCQLLAKRDQWLRYLIPLKQLQGTQDIRQLLTDMFEYIIEKELNELIKALPASLGQDMVDIARISALQLLEKGKKTAAHIDCCDLHSLPKPNIADIPLWQALAHLFLTSTGSWRTPKGVNRNHGFEPGSKDKKRYAAVYDHLIDDNELLLKFNNIIILPHVVYSDNQWQLLEALIVLLPACVGYLRLVFQRHSAMDFVEQALAARQAMGEGEQVTDLAMKLDYSLKHILMDEFQDTSHSQLSLLERLLEGWQPNDGRSLFLVGDPMQSIYRFREADVSGFLKVRDYGIAGIHPQSLILKANFRSTPKLVDWFNRVFPDVLADQDDLSLGAVSYSSAVSAVEDSVNSDVHVHAQLDREKKDEAWQVVEVVRQCLNDEPDGTIGILARSRSHLHLIYERLQIESIPFQAVEILPLSGLAVIQDLISVTRSLLHRHDRMAWLAVLRAPWCGLTLDSLHRLCADEPDEDLWQLINNNERQTRLVDSERQRLQHVIRSYSQIFDHAGHLTFRIRLEWLWKSLGADQCHAGSAQDTEAYFDLLTQLEQNNKAITLKSIDHRLGDLYSTTDNGNDCKVQLMTIHKSKGMQFDTVILPSLERTARPDKRALLVWHEEISEDYETRLLLAPMHAQGNDDVSFDFVRSREQKRKDYETQRLLYVGVTRAKRHLHLFATLTTGRNGKPLKPRAGSFLNLLDAHLRNEFASGNTDTAGEPDEAMEEDARQTIMLSRVAVGWYPAIMAKNIDWQGAVDDTEPVEFSWAGQSARLMGTVVHQYLHQIGEIGLKQWNSTTIQNRSNAISASLRSSGFPEDRLERTTGRIIDVLNNVTRSDRGQWLLAPHNEANSEYAISGVIEHNIVNRVIDRTFIDGDGVRWIIDYKTGSHAGGSLEEFLNEEQRRYRFQLEEYAGMLSVNADQQICLGLYFPLIDGWREWSYNLPD